MKSLLLVLSFYYPPNECLVKDTSPSSSKIYRVRVNEKAADSYNGYLHDIKDSSITVSMYPVAFGKIPETKFSIPYSHINSISIRKKGNIAKGIIYGSLAGIAVGGIFGALSYTPCNGCFIDFGIGLEILVGSLLGLISGGLTGALVGSKMQKFQINMQRENLQLMRDRMWLNISPQKQNK